MSALSVGLRLLLWCASLGLPADLLAQVDRRELGLRLREFERLLAESDDGPARHAALGELDRAVQAFFRIDTRGVAMALDAASRALLAREPTPRERLARRLQLTLPVRLVDAGSGGFDFVVSEAFPAAEGEPGPRSGLTLRLQIRGTEAPPVVFPLDELPFAGRLPFVDLPAGDHTLTWSVLDTGNPLATRSQGCSVVANLTERLAAVQAAATAVREPRDLEAATLPVLARMLAGMTRKRAEETVLPGARLLREAEELAAAIAAGVPYYGPARTGQHWLLVPVGADRVSVRLQARADTGGPAPLVVALHGMGGSENLFFDGYGDGALARACAERGWFLVAPRSVGLGGVDLAALVDALAGRWPIDTSRVAVIGHSMGAAQAIAHAGRTPARFRAVAALGGGGAVRRSDDLTHLPFFVGVGERDFARAGAQALHRALQGAGAKSQWREYPHVEHLAIVQFALPDVVAFFATAMAPR